MNYIHETILRDIMDIGSDLKDVDFLKKFKGKNHSIKSIASGSAGLTLVFPVLCSKSINIDHASMVTKAVERKATSMLQLLFAAKQTHDSDDVYDYLKNFHSNLKIDDKITVDGMLDIMDKIVTESTDVGNNLSEYEYKNLIMKDMKNINSYLEENVSEKSIMSYKIIPSSRYGSSIIIEKNKESDIEEYRKNKDEYRKDREDFRREVDEYRKNKDDYRRDKEDYRKDKEDARRDRDERRRESDRPLDRLSKSIKTSRDTKELFSKNNLIDSDVRKANELIPTLLSVNYIIDKGEGTPIPISFVVGVKAKLYAIDSLDIIDRLVAKTKDNNVLIKFIRATTREISFIKDFLFAIDQAKVDALSQSRRGSSSKLWKILERRSKKSKLRRRLGMNNDALAISTLVVSQEEINYIKKDSNIDLENPSVIRPIMEAYNIMGFCILDETNEVAKFIFDTGEDVYEHLSFNSLERETSDGGYKKAINLISKLTR